MTASGMRQALAAAALALAGGCSSAWTRVPLESLGPATESLGGERARFTLNDERMIEMRVLWVRYPFVEGHRVAGGWSTDRKLRLDLREVSRVEVRSRG
jgi:hypothetical protein